jgi:hypothetical protein
MSGNPCALPNTVISGGLTMHVTSGIKDVTFSGFSIAPNPTRGTFVITGETGNVTDEGVAVTIINMLGQTVYKTVVPVKNSMVNQQVVLNESLANGMYLIKLTAGADYAIFHMVLER